MIIRRTRRWIGLGDGEHGGHVVWIDREARRMGVEHGDGSVSEHPWSPARRVVYEVVG